MNDKKTHYAKLGEPAPICGSSYFMDEGNITSAMNQVTCKRCLKKLGLRK